MHCFRVHAHDMAKDNLGQIFPSTVWILRTDQVLRIRAVTAKSKFGLLKSCFQCNKMLLLGVFTLGEFKLDSHLGAVSGTSVQIVLN